MEELAQKIVTPDEFLRGKDLDNESGDKLCGSNKEEKTKSPL